MESEYVLKGNSEYDFNDRSEKRMKELNKKLKKRIDRVKEMAKKIHKDRSEIKM